MSEMMGRYYRRKPEVVEATPWHSNGDHPEVNPFRCPGVSGDLLCRAWGCGQVMDAHGWIDTHEGGRKVCPGDWIVTDVQGAVHPCKPDIFEQTYELETR